MKKYKNVYSFKMEKRANNSTGAWWWALGLVGGRWYSADSVFCGYSKDAIARILKKKILADANA